MMKRNNFLVACSVIIAIHLLLGVFAVLDNGYFILGAFAPERYLFHLHRDDGSRFTVSGSVTHYLDDICIQRCENCEFLCYPKENLEVVCDDGCGLESGNGNRLLGEGESPYVIAKEGVIFEGTTFLCNETAEFCSISTELDNNVFFDIRLPEDIPFRSS